MASVSRFPHHSLIEKISSPKMRLTEQLGDPVMAFIADSTLAECQLVVIGEDEGLIINTKNDFELALILKAKENKARQLREAIHDRIEEKSPEFRGKHDCKTVALIGHSQFDNWDIDKLLDYKVLNYGIRGISSFEYFDEIISKGKIDLCSDVYIVMHGTNDIIYNISDDEIFGSIMNTIKSIEVSHKYIKIFFLGCAHVNGRLDRDNDRIAEFNSYIKENLPIRVSFISLDEMNDKWGNLEKKYTTDGLHFSDEGYERLKEIIEENMRRKIQI